MTMIKLKSLQILKQVQFNPILMAAKIYNNTLFYERTIIPLLDLSSS